MMVIYKIKLIFLYNFIFIHYEVVIRCIADIYVMCNYVPDNIQRNVQYGIVKHTT